MYVRRIAHEANNNHVPTRYVERKEIMRLSPIHFKLILTLFVTLFTCSAWGLTCNSTGSGLNWAAAATWTPCNRIPTNADDVTILNGHTITIAAAGAVARNLTVGQGISGILQYGNGGNYTLVVGNATAGNGDVTVNAGGTFTLLAGGGANRTHALTIGGDVTNNGTLNFRVTGTRTHIANTTFNNNGNQTISGAGATMVFNGITVNMGATRANILDITAAGFTLSPTGFVNISNGTFKISANIAPLAPFDNGTLAAAPTDYLIPATGGFWLNSASTVNIATTPNPRSYNVSVDGTFRISDGTINIGDAGDERLRLRDTAGNTGLVQIDGGSLRVTGRLSSVTTTDNGTYTQSGGIVTVATIGNTIVTYGPFFLGSATSFNMSGGIIAIQTTSSGAANDYDVRSPTASVTGGTLQIGTASTPAAQTFDISSVPPVWNLVVNSTNSPTARLITSLVVNNDVTINTGTTLNANNLNMTVGAGNSTGDWTNNGSFTAGTGAVTFTGSSVTQAIGGTAGTTFNNFIINKALNNLTINTTPTVNGTLTFTQGKIVTAGNRIILGTAGTIATPTANSYVAGNFQKNYTAGAVLSYFAGNDFPVGDINNFTPVNISTGTTTTAGSLTVSTTAGDHPQVTTPIATTGIDAARSENRYWSFNNAGLTLNPNITAAFTFIGTVGADLDAAANTAAFIVERYDGVNWNPTTTGTLTATSSQASNIPLAAGNNDFAIGNPLAGFNGNPGAFNAFESAPITPAGAILGRIYTKRTGVNFPLAIVAIANNAINTAPSTNTLTIAILDATGTPGVFNSATNCWSGWPTVGTATTVTAPVGWVAGTGRLNVTITAPSHAVQNARIRISQTLPGPVTITGCSTDNFSIRPDAFTSITSSMSNATTAGTPRAKAGSDNFTLTALTSETVTPGELGYNGTPKLDAAMGLEAHVGAVQNGILSGVFSAAVTGVATGTAFTYSEVGNFRFLGAAATLGSTAVRGVYDDTFTSVDQVVGDCTNDFSNVLANGEYGCKFGIIANSSYFGRFYPNRFLLTPRTLTNRSNTSACTTGGTTTGTIAAASSSLSVASVTGLAVADVIVVRGAGVAGADLTATILTIAGTTLTLNTPAITAVANVSIYKPSMVAVHTYEGEALQIDFMLTAQNGLTIPTTTQNYTTASNFAKINLAIPASLGLGAKNLATILTSRLTAVSSAGTWTSGAADVSASLLLNRAVSADGPFNNFDIGIRPVDSDNVELSGYDMELDGSIVGDDHSKVGSTQVRWGRLRISNNYGSEKLDLPVSVAAQYWNGTAYVINNIDSCTPIANTNFVTPLTYVPPGKFTTTISGGGFLSGGAGQITLTKPNSYTGKGSVDLISGYSYLPGTGRETFGIYKGGPIIYMREIY